MFQNNTLLKMSYLLILLFPAFLQAQTVDLELSMTSNNPQVGIYDYVTITTTLQNTGTQSVDNAVVNFDIPTGTAIAGEFPPDAEQGSYEGFFGGSTEGNWFVGNVAAGQTLTFDITFFTLSQNPITFYGQVAQGGSNDPDSTPGNGTCCTANEDDEAGYTFPNDGAGCTFDQAYAELVCNDNGTPEDTSDDSYTLRFRADGSTGDYTLFIPELSYNQTSAYSSGFTDLTNLSLDIENLTLIFTDEAGTEDCGETLSVTAPSCGGIQPECEIIYNEISNSIDDMGTESPFDDTFTIVYTIENEGGGTGFVGQFGGQFCGQVPSTGTYGEVITFTANLANWGNGSPVGCQIIDNENPDCTGGYTLLPAVDCGFGNVCSDLELTAAITPTPDIYSDANAQFSLYNDFLGEDATGIQVTFNKNDLNVVGVPTVSQGSIDLFWTDNPVWNVGSLGSNQTATIDFDLYTLAANYSLYGQVTMQNENDFDSEPNNGNGVSPVEDDEAIYQNGGAGNLPDLVPSNLVVQNSPITVNNNLELSFDVTNIGTAPSGPSATIRAWISTDNVLSPDDIAGGSTGTEAFLPVDGVTSYSNIETLIPLGLPDGNYFIIIELDESDVILESNETNNTIAAPFTIGSETSCNLTIVNTQITCAENTFNSPFVFAIEVAGAVGNTVDYEILGTSFSGTIVVGQLVDVATLPQGLDFTIFVTEPNNGSCDYGLTSNIPVAPGICGNGGGGADVELGVSTGTNTPTGAYQAGEAIFTITNTSTTAATGLVVTFDKNQVNVTGTPTTTAGTAQLHWTDNPVWQVGTLAPGQSELIVFPVFTIGDDFGIYGEVTAMTEADSDSTPNNGNGSSPTEDDEALWPSGDTPPNELPDLVLTNTTLTINSTEIGGTIDYSFTIENQGDAPNMTDFVFTGFVTDDATISTPYSAQGTELVTDVINPGQSITRSGTFTLNQNVPNGYNYFGIIIDGGANVVESDETNNLYLDGLFFFDEANFPCTVNIELLDVACSATEGFYDFTIALTSQNTAPPQQLYTFLNDEFLGVETGVSGIYTFDNIPLSQGPSSLLIYDSSDSDCGDMITVNPPLDCGLIQEDGVDLSVEVSIAQGTVPVFSTFSGTITVTNEGTEATTGATIYVQPIDGLVFEGGNESSSTQGDFSIVSNAWTLETLEPGESAVLTVNYFTLQSGMKNLYAQVSSMNDTDVDSSPGNGTCCTLAEDDEGVAMITVLSNLTNGTPAALNTVSSIVAAYPNPATDVLTVEINSENMDAVNLEILDVTGSTQIFQELEGIQGVQTVKIPVSKLEKGIYLLSVRTGGETVIKRFVKM